MNEFQERARTIQAEYDAATERVRQDETLSVEGKTQRLQQLDERRRADVDALKAEAIDHVARERKTVDAQIAKLRAEDFAQRRAMLGDVILADLYRRTLSTLDSDGIERLYTEAADEFERELIRSLALVQLAEKAASDEYTLADMQLAHKLDATPSGLRALEVQRRELDEFGIDDLDREAWRDRMASTYGLVPSTIPM